MKDIIIDYDRISLSDNEQEKLKVKINHILCKFPVNFNSYNFSFLGYKKQIESDLESLLKDYPTLRFDAEVRGNGMNVLVSHVK